MSFFNPWKKLPLRRTSAAPKRVKAQLTVEELESRTVPTLATFASASGAVTLSLDGMGTNNANGGTIRVQKPDAAATVQSAYLLSATIPGVQITSDGMVTLNGAGINFVSQGTKIASNFGTESYWIDVTTLVASIVNPAPAGIISIPCNEGSETTGIDGEILAVIFNDPNQTTTNSIVLLFGAQNTTGDNFHINTSPINTSTPNLVLDMSLGDSFGYQTTNNGGQQSNITVNGTLITTTAGGQDDDQDPPFGAAGDPEGPNGTLITVGGIGDSDAAPVTHAVEGNPNPNDIVGAFGSRTDDELYNILPQVANNSTQILVTTLNPSDNDNIFFTAFNFKSAAAAVGESVVLTPLTSTQATGTQDTLTATVADNNGNPIPGKVVTFTVLSGPNANDTGMGTTNSNGVATFSYTSSVAGTDTIQASFTDSTLFTSNKVTSIWTSSQSLVSDVQAEWGTSANASIKNLAVLPWQSISKIDIVFSQNVIVGMGDLTLTGTSLGAIGFSGFNYNPATFTASWTLGTPLGTYTGVPYGIDTYALALSNNGGYNQTFKVLPGDVTAGSPSGMETVDATDLVAIRNAIPAAYNAFYDVDGDHSVSLSDYTTARKYLNQTV